MVMCRMEFLVDNELNEFQRGLLIEMRKTNLQATMIFHKGYKEDGWVDIQLGNTTFTVKKFTREDYPEKKYHVSYQDEEYMRRNEFFKVDKEVIDRVRDIALIKLKKQREDIDRKIHMITAWD